MAVVMSVGERNKGIPGVQGASQGGMSSLIIR